MGVDVAERPEGLFVSHVFPGGPAEKAGVKRGDRIIERGGQALPSGALAEGSRGQAHAGDGGAGKGSRPLTVTVTPRRVDPKAEWLEVQEKSSRIVERGGKRVAYQYVYSCAGSEHQEALAGVHPLHREEADALVVDFRDGWGGCNVEFLNLFNPSSRCTPRWGGTGSRW